MLIGGMGHSTLVQEALRKHFEGFEVEMDFEAGTQGCESLIANGAAAIASKIVTDSYRTYYEPVEEWENGWNKQVKDKNEVIISLNSIRAV